MGEIADMMLNGDLDEETGEWLGEGDGYPRRASDHEPRHDGGRHPKIHPGANFGSLKQHKCASCGRRFRLAVGLEQHMAATMSKCNRPMTRNEHAALVEENSKLREALKRMTALAADLGEAFILTDARKTTADQVHEQARAALTLAEGRAP